MRHDRILAYLARGYSDQRIAEITGASRGVVQGVRARWDFWFPERMAPRSRGPEQGAETSNATPTRLTGSAGAERINFLGQENY